MIMIDSHVHIYPCFNLTIFLESAYRNFDFHATMAGKKSNFTPIMILTESGSLRYFNKLTKHKIHKVSSDLKLGKWKITPNKDNLSIWMNHISNKKLLIIAGRQIKTKENLEVLVLFSSQCYNQGLSIHQTINEIKKNGGIAVLPWSPGKWFGMRGRIVDEIMRSSCSGNQPILFLGDIQGRPTLWPRPKQFELAEEMNIKILRGTDPLNFIEEQKVAGDFGFTIEDDLDLNRPASQLKNMILSHDTKLNKYGNSLSLLKFSKKQYHLRRLRHE